jgi:hypothetical protein
METTEISNACAGCEAPDAGGCCARCLAAYCGTCMAYGLCDACTELAAPRRLAAPKPATGPAKPAAGPAKPKTAPAPAPKRETGSLKGAAGGGRAAAARGGDEDEDEGRRRKLTIALSIALVVGAIQGGLYAWDNFGPAAAARGHLERIATVYDAVSEIYGTENKLPKDAAAIEAKLAKMGEKGIQVIDAAAPPAPNAVIYEQDGEHFKLRATDGSGTPVERDGKVFETGF